MYISLLVLIEILPEIMLRINLRASIFLRGHASSLLGLKTHTLCSSKYPTTNRASVALVILLLHFIVSLALSLAFIC